MLGKRKNEAVDEEDEEAKEPERSLYNELVLMDYIQPPLSPSNFLGGEKSLSLSSENLISSKGINLSTNMRIFELI